MTNGDFSDVLHAQLVESGAYKDLETPVLITSGESLTPFFVNAEKLAPHSGEALEAYGRFKPGDPAGLRALFTMAESDYYKDEKFEGVINALAEKITSCYGNSTLYGGSSLSIFGGERRDWIFSVPVAAKLRVPHITFFKNPKQPQSPQEFNNPEGSKDDKTSEESGTSPIVYNPERGTFRSVSSLPNARGVHIVDMLTKGSSFYTPPQDSSRAVNYADFSEGSGWLSQAAALGAQIQLFGSVVSRQQGGEELLQGLGIRAFSLTVIDDAFLRAHSSQPVAAIAYRNDEVAWTKDYLESNGIELLVPYFNPLGSKLPRAQKFMNHYGDWLEQKDLLHPLNAAVEKKYGMNLVEIVGGKK